MSNEVASFMVKESISLDCISLALRKTHELKYPYLAVLAESYLAVPAPPAPMRGCFLAAGEIVSGSRSVLSPDKNFIYFLRKLDNSLSWLLEISLEAKS